MSKKQFDDDLTKDWPEWTKWLADLIVSTEKWLWKFLLRQNLLEVGRA